MEGGRKEGEEKKKEMFSHLYHCGQPEQNPSAGLGDNREGLSQTYTPPTPGSRELGYLSTSSQQSLVENCSRDGHSLPSTSDLSHRQAERLRARESPQVLTAGSLSGKSRKVHAQGIWAGAEPSAMLTH